MNNKKLKNILKFLFLSIVVLLIQTIVAKFITNISKSFELVFPFNFLFKIFLGKGYILASIWIFTVIKFSNKLNWSEFILINTIFSLLSTLSSRMILIFIPIFLEGIFAFKFKNFLGIFLGLFFGVFAWQTFSGLVIVGWLTKIKYKYFFILTSFFYCIIISIILNFLTFKNLNPILRFFKQKFSQKN